MKIPYVLISRALQCCFKLVLLASFLYPRFARAFCEVDTTPDLWLIEMSVKTDIYNKMKNTNRRIYFGPETFHLNGISLLVKEMHTRGKTTLNFWRKSYTVELESSIDIDPGVDKTDMDHFYLISMSMDRNYFHNRLAFDCLEELDLFALYYHYVEVKINDQSEGLYLLVQRPTDYALEKLGTKAILRRGSTEFISEGKYAKSEQRETEAACKKTFREIGLSGKRKGEELYRYLNKRMDLNSYFCWLAFNYLVRNGDYTDEVFYYVQPDQPGTRFGIIPWDFDDILVTGPHEGIELRNKRLGDQLIFSSEDKLDRIIAQDSFLYQKYLAQLEIVTDRLNSELIDNIFESIKSELRPYYLETSIVEASKHDLQPSPNWEEVEQILNRTAGYLKTRCEKTRQLIVPR